MTIRCAWWNTSLAPTKASGRASESAKTIALSVISELLSKQGQDILGMCELSDGEITWLKEKCDPIGYDVVSGVGQSGHIKTDTCIIFRRSTFDLVASRNFNYEFHETQHKIAQRVELRIKSDNTILNIFASHWPSVMHKNPDRPERVPYGLGLRYVVDEILSADKDAKIVLMGDYNDEPFNHPLSYFLQATRDRQRVQLKKKLLYNPFWNRIGGDRNYLTNPTQVGFCGTHFYSADKIDRWRTFDQIIVSASLLDSKSWHLDESSVDILNIPFYTPHVLGRKEKFDHFPVAITINRGEK